jgi:hypothetical protein
MIALMISLALALAPAQLSIQPWTGNDFQNTASTAAKYRLRVSGRPNTTLRLHAEGVARGWLAAFCTPKLCSPQQVEVQIPQSGDTVFQFELIRESDNAPNRSGATIVGSDGASVSVPAAFRH